MHVMPRARMRGNYTGVVGKEVKSNGLYSRITVTFITIVAQ